MTKRTIVTVLILTLSLALFFACNNDSTPERNDFGYTISGKITLDGDSFAEVMVLVDTHETTTSDSNGLFSLIGLDEDVIITFEKEGFVFYPNEISVKESILDLRVTAYPETPHPDGENGPEDGNSSNNPDSGNDGEDAKDPPANDPDGGDKNEITESLYDCKNGGLLFENDILNFVFCVESGFTSVDIFIDYNNQISTSEVPDECMIGTYTMADVTYVQYKIPLPFEISSTCTFTAKAKNSANEYGKEAVATFVPQSTCAPAQISLCENILMVESRAEDARHYLLLNGVNVGEVEGTTVNLSSFTLLDSGICTVEIMSVKQGCIAVFSNVLTVSLEGN